MLCHQPQSERERRPLPSRKSKETGAGVYVVYDRIWIIMPGDIDAGNSQGPFVASEREAFFEPQIQTEIVRKSHTVRCAHQLLVFVDNAEWKSRTVLQKPADQKFPNR